MFQKEGSCTDIISSSSGGGKSRGKGKGKQQPPPSKSQQQENPTTISKAVDVPLRKSDRRQLRQRAATYFFGASSASVEAVADLGDAKDDISNESPMESLLDEIFLRGGTISARILPRSVSKSANTSESKTKGNHENMVLYVKSPSSSETERNTSYWPYQKKKQFVWIALQDKKSGIVLHDTPSVALLAVVSHNVILPEPERALAVSFWEHFEKTRVVTTHSPVSRYLCRGADLMRAGIISAPKNQLEARPSESVVMGNQKKNQKKKDKSSLFADGAKDMVVICAKGNPQPFAVGRSILWSSPTSDDKPYGYGTKGIGVEVWNCFGDDLWRTTMPAGGGGATTNTGDLNIENGSYGNPGFCVMEKTGELCVLPLVGYDDDDDGEEEEEENGDEQESDKDNEATIDNESNVEKANEENATTGDEILVPSQSNSTEPTNSNDGDCDNKKTEHETETKAIETESPPSPDEILHMAVCQALVNLKKNDLPMLVGTFYTKHVLSNIPKGVESANLLKQSSYKKFGNYLREWQIIDKDDSGLIQTGPDPSNRMNKDPHAFLFSFNRRHEDLYGMKKTNPSGGPGDGGSADGNSKIALVKLHVVPNHWTKLLRLDPEDVSASNASSEARRGSSMLTLPEVKKILDGYLQRESSLMISKSMVALDGPLSDALFGKKSREVIQEKLSRKELSKRFVEKMSPAYCLVRMPGSHVTKLGRGTPPKVQIEVVKRQSKKFVTRLRGLEEYLGGGNTMDPSDFCKVVSKRLAISGSVDSDPAASGRAALPKKGCVEYTCKLCKTRPAACRAVPLALVEYWTLFLPFVPNLISISLYSIRCALAVGANVVDEIEALLTGDETLSEHGGTKGSWAYPRIPGGVIEVTLRKGVPARKKRRGGGGGKQ